MRRSPVYTFTMCPIIPTDHMLSIAPYLLATQRLILRPWRESDRPAFARLNADPAVMEFFPRCWSHDESDATAIRIQNVIEQRGWGFWAVEVKSTDVGVRGTQDATASSAPGAARVPDTSAHGASLAHVPDTSAHGIDVASPDARVGGGAHLLDDSSCGAPFIGFVGLSVPSFTSHFTPCVEIGWRIAKEYWGNGYASEAAAASLHFGFEKLKLQQIVAFTVPTNKRSIAVMERIGMSRNPADDFDHPNLQPGHPLQRHVLYRIAAASYSG